MMFGMSRECVDHIIVLGERHLRHVLLSYVRILSLNKDAPAPRSIQRAGYILCRPILGGLHHLDCRGFTASNKELCRQQLILDEPLASLNGTPVGRLRDEIASPVDSRSVTTARRQ
jgi:hypothetical protein